MRGQCVITQTEEVVARTEILIKTQLGIAKVVKVNGALLGHQHRPDAPVQMGSERERIHFIVKRLQSPLGWYLAGKRR